jgi:hypothetical protein
VTSPILHTYLTAEALLEQAVGEDHARVLQAMENLREDLTEEDLAWLAAREFDRDITRPEIK